MKKFIGFVLLLILCCALCACDYPLKEVELPNKSMPVNTVYISGAVKNDGYFELEAGADYFALASAAGMLAETLMPDNPSLVVDGKITTIVFDFIHNGIATDSINVNGVLVTNRFPIDCVSCEIIDKLADYIEYNGVIANRRELKIALGDDYEDNYYKFFISEQDYEA